MIQQSTIMNFNYLLVCLILSTLPTRGVFMQARDVFELTAKVFKFVKNSWEIVHSHYSEKEILEGENTSLQWYTKKKEQELMTNFGRITQLVFYTRKNTEDVMSMMLGNLKKLQSMPNVVLHEIQINKLLESIRSIENDYTTMEAFKIDGDETREKMSYSSYTLEKFADAMLSHNYDSPRKQLSKIHLFIVPEWESFKFHTHGGIFNILKHTMGGFGMLCNEKQSLQQLIYNLYTTLHLTQLKGFAIMQFSWMLLQTYDKGNFTFEKTKHQMQFEKKISEQLNALKMTMSSTSNMYWRCDPEKHIKGKTYFEISQLLQGYVENESHMNSKQSCMKNCGYYDVAKHKACYPDELCSKQSICNGTILNCRYIDSDMKICLSNFGSNRRYEYVSYKNGKVLGDSSGSCQGTISKVDSWWYFLIWHCSYCFCICDSMDAFSDRYFSLKISESNIRQNKVVTGLRFTKIKQMFHLQVQEGELGPRGIINEYSRQWVELPGEEFNFENKTLKEGIDYHVLTYDARAFDLDSVIAPPNTVITGVQLRMIGTHLNLQIFVSQFDFLTGKLNLELGSYITENEYSGPPRLEIDIDNSDLPTKSTTASEPDMSPNKYIKFTHSSIDHDVAQTTLPFIDIQPVEPYPGVPLSGVGIYFKGTKNYGGFIGPSVFTYNFSENMNSSLFFLEKL